MGPLNRPALAELKLAASWEPPAVEREEGTDKIRSAPFRCSYTEDRELYVRGAKVPKAAARLYGQPRRSILEWIEEQTKLKPVVIETKHAIIVSALKPARARGLTTIEKNWLLRSAGKVGAELTSVQRAHLYAWRYLRAEAEVMDLLGHLKGSPRKSGYMPSGHFGVRGKFEFYLISGLEAYQAFGRHFFGAFGQHASMLLGVTEPLRRRILAEGHALRVYVPYGGDWYGYCVRRLKENPKIGRHVLFAMFKRR